MTSGATPHQRGAILAGILIGHVALFTLLLWQAPLLPPKKEDRQLVVFSLSPDAPEQAAHKAEEEKRTQHAPPPPPPPPEAAPPPPQLSVPDPPPVQLPGMIILSRENFAAADIGRIAKAPGHGTGPASPSQGPSDGPGGVALVNANWYRKPTNAELATYLPARAPSGYGMIACQTAPKYHVENCRLISESPPGMGLAQAVRRAAWQFLVIPPRVNGEPQIGAWVRIRIDYLPPQAAGTGRKSLPYPPPPPDPEETVQPE